MATPARLATLVNLLKNAKIYDNPNQGVISISFDTHVATVTYQESGDVYDLTHTDIPEQLHGKGLGSIFAERIFEYLIQQNKRIKLSCEFLDHYYQKNVHKYEQFVVSE